MGQPVSKEARGDKARSDAIDRQITEDSKRYKKEAKILLLGSGESGKSTIVKQMKIIHQAGFDTRERAEYRTTIYKNVLDSAATLARVIRRVGMGAMGVLPSGRERGGIPTGRVSARPGTAEGVMPAAAVLAQTHAKLTPALADAIWHVARAPAVEKLVDEHPADFYLMDSAGYFFSAIHRIAAPTYVPSEEDVLRARAKSTAIIETRFWMGDLMIHMFDVGGQRSERKKWIHCFESVTSIIFCTALSEYDQVLEEERRVNRMRESLYLFESVINSRWFLRTSVILFLNKIDVFKRKLPKIPLGRYFPEYAGGNDLQKAAKYILWKFMQENRAKLTVYPHVTQATNTKNIRLVFAAVKETILQNALKDSGIL
ncbi:heterotrimeric G-protein alpha subunit, GPA3-like protein [Mycena albidolilacea]|uniref:Heterotrimeric G-protein alpha subunit, GPA3-like protein n=1 Tax=Mycena albidolilacea TaxID=1033008 RepID=A0AAD7A7N6_9AGAR|nr:heterotrimeric G-protein alpha subunit, GPA3-like protein [Mycena albidolilacea]